MPTTNTVRAPTLSEGGAGKQKGALPIEANMEVDGVAMDDEEAIVIKLDIKPKTCS